MTDNACVQQAQRVQKVAAHFCGIPIADLADGYDPQSNLARQLAMYLTNRVYRLSHGRTAAMFGRDRRAAAYACRRIEALRDDPKFDWQVFEVETVLRAADVLARETNIGVGIVADDAQ